MVGRGMGRRMAALLVVGAVMGSVVVAPAGGEAADELVAAPPPSLRVEVARAKVDLGEGLSVSFGLRDAVSAGDPGRSLAPGVASPSAEVAVEGHEASFAEVVPGVGVEFALGASQLKETLVLDGPDAPDRFVFDLALEGLRARFAKDGSVELVDIPPEVPAGEEPIAETVVARIPPGFMVDSSVPEGQGDAAMSWCVSYQLAEAPTGAELVVQLDRAWLDDPARVFPVLVDPTVLYSELDGTYVTACAPADNSALGTLKVGTTGGLPRRSYLHVDSGAALLE